MIDKANFPKVTVNYGMLQSMLCTYFKNQIPLRLMEHER
jgi:hypothetical protein